MILTIGGTDFYLLLRDLKGCTRFHCTATIDSTRPPKLFGAVLAVSDKPQEPFDQGTNGVLRNSFGC
jgi:hypothetical protein